MPNIVPVQFPILGTASRLEVTVLGFTTNAKTTNLYYQLVTDNNVKCVEGNYQLTEEEFLNWGTDNEYINIIVANLLGVVIIN